MTATSRTYGHFCLLAKALDRVGDRWALLVVRDLAGGPKRFTDLQERLGGITAKTLSTRLRDLEADGVVAVDRVPGRRDVWYSLTAAGADLKPVVEELVSWGLRHALAPPEPGEPAHPEHLLLALRILLERERVFVDRAVWVLRLVDDGTYTMRGTSDGWSLAQGADDHPQVTITTTKASWAAFLASRPEGRAGMADRVHVEGSPDATAAFIDAIAVFPLGRRRSGQERLAAPPGRPASVADPGRADEGTLISGSPGPQDRPRP